MSEQPKEVNGAVADSDATANAKVVAEAPAVAMGSLYQTIENSTDMASTSAGQVQQQVDTENQSSGTLGVTKLIEQNDISSTQENGEVNK